MKKLKPGKWIADMDGGGSVRLDPKFDGQAVGGIFQIDYLEGLFWNGQEWQRIYLNSRNVAALREAVEE